MSQRPTSLFRFASLALKGGLLAAALYVVVAMVQSGAVALGTITLGVVALTAYVFGARRTYAARYLYPGLFGVALFVVLPLVYTVWIGLTRYSSDNLLTFDRATSTLLSRTVRKGDGAAYLFTLHREGNALRLVLQPESESGEPDEPDAGDSIFGEDGDASDAGDAGSTDDSSIFDDEPDAGPDAGSAAGAAAAPDAGPAAGPDAAPTEAADAGTTPTTPAPATTTPPSAPARYLSAPFVAGGTTPTAPITVAAVAMPSPEPALSPPLELQEIVALQSALAKVSVTLPSGELLVNTGLRAFAAEIPLYRPQADGSLVDVVTQVVYTANFDTGFYQSPAGERLIPGFRVFVGAEHFVRIFTDPAFRGPTVSIFLWTVTFAGLSVLFTLVVGALLAELFSWEGLRGRTVYRLLLFIPYAVPSFISILIFKGLFNEGFGEINVALGQLLGIQPHWFTDSLMAKVMILIVNTWLGFPYMMILCMGLRQSIPKDLYEASALAGAGPFTNYFKITWPLIRRPLLPLLIASFAFNFNNVVLINLLTDGRPDILGAKVPAGTNDLLATFNWRIAFQDATKDYGLAAAIATVVFIIVAALSILNLRLTRAAQRDGR